MKLSELGDMVGKDVSIERYDPSEPMKASTHLTGELLAFGAGGLVVRTKDGVEIIETLSVVDVVEAAPNRKIIRRKVRYIPTHQARQHLLDRHNIPWSLVREMTPETAHKLHERIDHHDLGHRHRPEGEGGEE